MDAQQSPHTKVFIQRDFSDGIAVKFQTRYPPELEGRVCLLIAKTIFFFYEVYLLFG